MESLYSKFDEELIELLEDVKKIIKEIGKTKWELFESKINDIIKNNEEVLKYASIKKLNEWIENKNIGDEITNAPGVYFVLKTNNFSIKLENEERKLKNDLIEKSSILYIGKTENKKDGLKGRIKDYINTGNEKSKKHTGGKKIWEIKNNKDLLFCWIPFEVKDINAASILESLLIICYQFRHDGKYPFANSRN